MAYTKQRIVFYNKKNYKPPTITKLLFEREDIIVSRQGVAHVLKIYKETGTIDRCRGVTVRLQCIWTASCQQISTPPLKTGPVWINASTRMRVFNTVTAICYIAVLYHRSTAVLPSLHCRSTVALPSFNWFFKRSHRVATIKRYGMESIPYVFEEASFTPSSSLLFKQ